VPHFEAPALPGPKCVLLLFLLSLPFFFLLTFNFYLAVPELPMTQLPQPAAPVRIPPAVILGLITAIVLDTAVQMLWKKPPGSPPPPSSSPSSSPNSSVG
jgi:hypothetical protein